MTIIRRGKKIKRISFLHRNTELYMVRDAGYIKLEFSLFEFEIGHKYLASFTYCLIEKKMQALFIHIVFILFLPNFAQKIGYLAQTS